MSSPVLEINDEHGLIIEDVEDRLERRESADASVRGAVCSATRPRRAQEAIAAHVWDTWLQQEVARLNEIARS